MVGARPGRSGREVSRLLDAVGSQRVADQRRTGLRRADSGPADAGEGDTRPGHYPAGNLGGYRDAHGGEVAYPALQLEIAAAGRALRCRDHGLDGDLVVTERVLERAAQEVGHRDPPLAGWPLRDDVAAQGGYHRGPVTLRVRMAQRADQSAAVPDDRIRDQRSRRRHHRLLALQQLRPLQVSVPAQRADPDRAIRVLTVVIQARKVV